MFKVFFVILIPISTIGLLYGVYNIFFEVGPNECRMTYMFAPPQFLKINLKISGFPLYGLYYYNEGRQPKSSVHFNLTGAPIIFIPGNGGSYKQVRSLASVALQKGINDKNGVHLDYFTLNFNEELSALHGAYLERQTIYLKHCIKAVINLYRDNGTSDKELILIGHSMGGKIAQAVLADVNVLKFINTVILVSTPVDKPVLRLDKNIDDFYKKVNNFMYRNRDIFDTDNSTNTCGKYPYIAANSNERKNDLSRVLLISIGGGSRDMLVQSGLTRSKFSDIHTLTSSIPKVWLSCDHLSAVWCLQFILVINRFLFNISFKNADNVYFYESKTLRLQKAIHFFVSGKLQSNNNGIDVIKKYGKEIMWHEDSRRVFARNFKNGFKYNYVEMISLSKGSKFKILYLEINNMSDDDLLIGCVANVTLMEKKKYCKSGISLSHHFQSIPSDDGRRSYALINIQNIRNTYKNWTHVALILHSSKKSIQYIVDIHDTAERYLHLKAPRWFGIQEKNLINETLQGVVYYKVLIEDLHETFETIQLRIKSLSCSHPLTGVTVMICIPWAPGFSTHKILPQNKFDESVYVNFPVVLPNGYNTTSNPIVLQIFLNPSCRYRISYQFSIKGTLSRIVHQFWHWIPSHVAAVTLIILRGHISQLYSLSNVKSINPYNGFFQYTSFFIIPGCRLFKNFPDTDVSNLSIYLIALIHSSAIVMSILLSFLIWGIVVMFGNSLSRISSRCMPVSMLKSLSDLFPVIFGACIILLMIQTCSEIAFIITCIVYILMISNAYKRYMENWIWMTAIMLFKKHRKDKIDVRIEQNTMIRCDGLNNFSFHILLFILLLILTSINIMTGVVWIKGYRNESSFKDPSYLASMVALGALSLLWQFNAPTKITSFKLGYKAISAVIYFCALGCIVFCQEAIYRLNYVIAFVYVVLVLQEIMCHIYKFYENKTK